MSGTLDGRVALVTGTSQGIGRACAEALLEAGATVAGCVAPANSHRERRPWLASSGQGRRFHLLPTRSRAP